MNLLTLQQYDYNFGCVPYPKIARDIKYGLFMHCPVNNDVDSYLMNYCELKTLRDNTERLLDSLNKVINNIEEIENE